MPKKEKVIYEYECEYCNKQFLHRKKDKKYCSILCTNAARANKKLFESAWKFETRNCIKCSAQFNPTYKPQQYCSRACSMTVRGEQKTKTNTYVGTCSWCKSEVVKRLSQKGKHNDFCSIKCGEAFKRGHEEKYVKKFCKNVNCNKEFETLYRRQAEFCSKSCTKSGEYHHFFGVNGEANPNYGMIPWTKGLTKDTDKRIEELSNKVSKTHKQQFVDGIRDNHGENNPNHNFTRKQKERSQEQLKNYSNGATYRITNCNTGGYHNCIKGIHVSIKCNKKHYYKSTYELKMMNLLDFDPLVKLYDVEPFAIDYLYKNKPHKYIPDFVVYGTDNANKIIEVKGWIRDVEQYEAKCLAAKQYVSSRNMTYEVWFLSDIKNYENELKLRGIVID